MENHYRSSGSKHQSNDANRYQSFWYPEESKIMSVVGLVVSCGNKDIRISGEPKEKSCVKLGI